MPNDKTIEVCRWIAANLRKQRAKQSLTQEALAELAGIDLRHLQSIEGAKENPTVATLVALSEALEIKPGLLFRKATLPLQKRGRPRKLTAKK